jgi:hypothetical protein
MIFVCEHLKKTTPGLNLDELLNMILKEEHLLIGGQPAKEKLMSDS